MKAAIIVFECPGSRPCIAPGAEADDPQRRQADLDPVIAVLRSYLK